MQTEHSKSVVEPSKPRLLKILGPGLITGASDDDPSGIATYSQAGAQWGYRLGWTLLLTYPMMVAIQAISARIGRTTGKGLAGNLRAHYPRPILYGIVALLFAANTLNIAADLSAMGEAANLVIPRLPGWAAIIAFGLGCTAGQIFLKHTRYVAVLKWLTLSLLSYFAVLSVVRIPWREVATSLIWPSLTPDKDFWLMVVAILGTTISPYLFFWQAAQEVEDTKSKPRREPLLEEPNQAPNALARIQLDTIVGMGLSNVVALAIMVTAAATLHAGGHRDIQTAAQAAEALRPVAGEFAFVLFALGIVGTGLLAVPVLAGSAAYAVGEARRWPVGLARAPGEAKAFYGTIAVATALGAVCTLAAISPVKALIWAAVINAVVSVPTMVILMLMGTNRRIMGQFTLQRTWIVLGWTATGVMFAATVTWAVAG